MAEIQISACSFPTTKPRERKRNRTIIYDDTIVKHFCCKYRCFSIVSSCGSALLSQECAESAEYPRMLRLWIALETIWLLALSIPVVESRGRGTTNPASPLSDAFLLFVQSFLGERIRRSAGTERKIFSRIPIQIPPSGA